MPGDILALLGMLLTVIVVLALAYFCTRYLAGRGLGGLGTIKSGGKIHILDQLPLGKDLRLILVQVGERYLLLGIAPAGVTQLAELTAEEAAQWRDGQDGGGAKNPLPNFRDAFLESLKKRK